MTRSHLAIGAAAVLAAIVILYYVVAHDGVATHEPIMGAPGAGGPRKPDVDPGVPGTKTRAPALDQSPATPPSPSAKVGATEQTIGGIRVRDHRPGDHAPLEIPPAIHPPGGRKIPPQLTFAISQQVRAVVAGCMASVPASDRGPAARLAGQVMIAIRDHQATVTGAVMQLRDMTGAAVDAAKQCVEQKSIGITAASGDEATLEDYAITLSVDLP